MTDPPAGPSHRRGQQAALAILCVVLFLTFLDNTVVSVGLADIQSDLQANVTSLQWVVNGYALTFAAFMLAGGTLGDILGRKKVMLVGVAIFCGGSVLSAVAPGTGLLIAGRVVMGLGAAASEPGTLSEHSKDATVGRDRHQGGDAAYGAFGSGLHIALRSLPHSCCSPDWWWSWCAPGHARMLPRAVGPGPPSRGFAPDGPGYAEVVEDQEDGHRLVGTAFVGVSPGTRTPRRQPPGRTCAEERCDTLLSIYNDSEHCSVHAAAPKQIPGRRRSTTPAH